MIDASSPGLLLAHITRPLSAKFGATVSFTRGAHSACWEYRGQSVVVEMSDAQTLQATFFDVARADVVTKGMVAAVYRCRPRYALDASGASRIVADLVDFFSGVREPAFTFIDVLPR